MKNYEVKTITGGIMDVDDKTRMVTVCMNEMGSKDLDNEVMDDDCYNKTIKERGPKGVSLIWHLTDHTPSLKSAVGKPKEISAVSHKLVYKTPIEKTTWGNDVLEMYKSGSINQHSIGYRTIKAEPVDAGKPGEYRLIKEVLLYEGSAVLWGANPNTPTLTVGKTLTKEEAEKDFLDTLKELTNFTSLFKNGHLSDQTFELIEMKMAQLTEKLQHHYHSSTKPAEESAVEPQTGKGLLDVLTAFNNTLTLQNYARLNSGTTVG